MIVEDERHTYNGNFDYDHVDGGFSANEVLNGPLPNFATYMQRRAHIREKTNHRQLQADLVEHIWEGFGQENNQN
jgi:hypothetical protein